jgi:uncharacterized repeat protein (TIGR03803 family)
MVMTRSRAMTQTSQDRTNTAPLTAVHCLHKGRARGFGRPLFLLAALFLTLMTTTGGQAAPVLETVTEFARPPAKPGYGALTRDSSGWWWGVTQRGGSNDAGTIYKLSGDGQQWQVVVSFTGMSGAFPGAMPYGSLCADGQGWLWGTASEGGENGDGVIFRVHQSTGVYEVRAAFSGAGGLLPGSAPFAGLTADNQGLLWGTTAFGGANGDGVLFSINTVTAEVTVVLEFDRENNAKRAAHPFARLLRASDGLLWGVSSSGGVHGKGTLFRWNPQTSSLTVMLDFTGTAGAAPGSFPYGELAQAPDGRLWGMTFFGGSQDRGVVFRFEPGTSSYVKVLDWTGNSGSAPGGFAIAGLVRSPAGIWWGTTSGGGSQGRGTLFKLTDAGALTVLAHFRGTIFPEGAGPAATLSLDPGGFLLGTTESEGSTDGGTVFRLNLATEALSTVLQFTDPASQSQRGHALAGRLADHGEPWLYGSAQRGGLSGRGVLFKVDRASGVVTTLADFTGLAGAAPGSMPRGPLLAGPDGRFWGVTEEGGASDSGTVFSIDPRTGNFASVIQFTDSGLERRGSRPVSGLTPAPDGQFWGTTAAGASGNHGTVFRVNPFTSAFVTVIEFTGAAGAFPGRAPEAELFPDPLGRFWGTTSMGGSNGHGTLFRLDPATGSHTLVAAFTGGAGALPGSRPVGEMAADGQGWLWGITREGGADGFGTVFRVNLTTSAVEVVHVFDGAAAAVLGGRPVGGLTLHQGWLWGQTSQGGAAGGGVIFRLDPATPAPVPQVVVDLPPAKPGERNLAGLLSSAYDSDLYALSLLGGASGGGRVLRVRSGPEVRTTAASGVGASGATLNGSASGVAGAAAARFEYGLAPEELTLMTASQALPGEDVRDFSASLTGLQAGTTYYYRARLDGGGAGAPQRGAVLSFTTTGSAPAQPLLKVEQPAGAPLRRALDPVFFGFTVSGSSLQLSFRLRNEGNAPLTGLSLGVSGAHPGDFVASSLAGTTLAAGQDAVFTVTFSPLGAGNREAVLTVGGNDPGGAFTVPLRGAALFSQTITFPAIPQQVCGTPLVLNAAASSGLPVTYQILEGSSVVSLAGGVMEFLRAGSVTIRAQQGGSVAYAAATPVTRSFTVVRGTQTLGFDPPLPASVSHRAVLNVNPVSNRGVTGVSFSLISGPGVPGTGQLSFTGPGQVALRLQHPGNEAFLEATADVSITATNSPPVAGQLSLSGLEDTLITGSLPVTDADGDPLSFTVTQPPAHGTLTVFPNGTFNYMPGPDYFGPDTFRFTASDGRLQSGTGQVFLTIDPVNDPPTIAAPADVILGLGESTGLLPFLIGDAETPAGQLLVSAVSNNPLLVPPAGIVLSGSGAQRGITVTPDPERFGTARITISVSDGELVTEGSFNVRVNSTAFAVEQPVGTARPLGSLLDLGSVAVGQEVMLAFGLRNTGNVAFPSVELRLAQESASDFSISGPQGLELLPNGLFVYEARFQPAAAGQQTVDFEVLSDGEALYFGRLAGRGQSARLEVWNAEGLALAPEALIQFGGVLEGAEATVTLQVRNTGELGMTGLGAVLAESGGGQFMIATPLPQQLPAGESAELMLRFKPDSIGAAEGRLEIQSNDPQRPVLGLRLAGSSFPQQPRVVSLPLSQLAVAGQALEWRVGTTGADPRACEWYKNGRRITAWAGFEAEFPALKAADAGRYSALVRNRFGIVETALWFLGVMNPAPARQSVNEGANLRIAATVRLPAGVTASFRWLRNGEELADGPGANGGVWRGAGTRTLTLVNTRLEDAGELQCRVTAETPAGPVIGTPGVTLLEVVRRPVAEVTTLEDAFVGQVVEEQLSAQNGATRFQAIGLPRGVRLDPRTGRLTGSPLAPRLVRGQVEPYRIRVRASNSAGASPFVELTWLIKPLPEDERGIFQGLVDRDGELNGALGGDFQLTVAPTANCSGFLTAGGRRLAFRGRLIKPANGDPAHAEVTIRRGRNVDALELGWQFAAGGLNGKLRVAGDPVPGESNVQAKRAAWSRANPATELAGTYTAAIAPGVPPPEAVSVPQGDGLVTLTVSMAGLLRWSARLPDGTTATGAANPAADGSWRLQRFTHRNTGSAQGWNRIDYATGELDGELTWSKAPQPAGRVPPPYPSGFPAIPCQLTGGLWVPPPAGQLPAGFAAAGSLGFSGGALPGDWDTSVVLQTNNRMSFPDGDFQIRIASLSFRNGLFHGSFKLDSPDDRRAVFHGVLIQRFGEGRGFHLMNEADATPPNRLSGPLRYQAR